MITIEKIGIILLTICLFGLLQFSPVASAAVCTLSNDPCNNSQILADCSKNSACWPYSYKDLMGNNKIICGAAITNNACITKDYAGCWAAGPSCRWYGAIEDLPITSVEDSALSPFPSLNNPLKSSESPQALVGKIINIIMGIVGSLALIMFIFGGLSWMTAGGNEEKVKKSIGILVWSVLGLVVIFLSYVLVNFLIQNAKL